ncbi:MAG: carboxymuconolactone decarboxylase family protein [Gemmatimonadetes bacterium]|nr:carboxymuconolactone decarboxylase family protein [Gemmatimonadota bacterium]
MAFIRYTPEHGLRPEERVADPDNIIQIHAGHPSVMRHHHGLYRALMHDPGPLPRRLREMVAVRISALNHCRY